GSVVSVCFSPDGMRVAMESADLKHGEWVTTAQLWDARTGQELPGRPDFPLAASPLSPDGRYLALPRGDAVVLIDVSPPGEIELGARLWATRHDPWWHAEQAALLQKEQPSAAAFHRALAANV